MRLPIPEESTIGTFSRFTTKSRIPVAIASLHRARNSSRLSPKASLPSTVRMAVVPCFFNRVGIGEHDTPFSHPPPKACAELQLKQHARFALFKPLVAQLQRSGDDAARGVSSAALSVLPQAPWHWLLRSAECELE